MDGKIRRGQVTIFIILGVIIVVAIIMAIFLRQDIVNFFGGNIEPKVFIKTCITSALEPSMKKVLENAGDLNPELTKMYNGSKYNYLCYQANDYFPCINTHPMIKTTVEQSLTEDTKNRVEQCFLDLKDELENRGNTVTEGDLNYSVELVPGSILVHVTEKLDVSKEDSSQSFEDFSFELNSQMYDLFNLAREIVNQESQYCYFEELGFMNLYPSFVIIRVNYDNVKIYTAKNLDSNEKIKFAVRGCVKPAGI